jgi:hypothetical protein
MEDAKLRRTATCKAGHAVAHVRLGLEHRRVSIGPGRIGLISKAENEATTPVSDAKRARLVTLVHCAGYAALIATGYSEEDALRCTSDDLRKANDLIERWHLRADLAAWKAEALDLIQRPENVAAVRLVAQHLLERQKLDSDWVGCVLALLDGDMTNDEFAAYVRFRQALR